MLSATQWQPSIIIIIIMIIIIIIIIIIILLFLFLLLLLLFTHSILVGYVQSVTINLFCSDEERKLTAGSGEKKHSAAPPGIEPRVFRFVHGRSRPLSYEATTEACV